MTWKWDQQQRAEAGPPQRDIYRDLMKKTNGQYDEAQRITKIKDPEHRHVIRCMRSGLIKSKCELTKGTQKEKVNHTEHLKGQEPEQTWGAHAGPNSRTHTTSYGSVKTRTNGGKRWRQISGKNSEAQTQQPCCATLQIHRY